MILPESCIRIIYERGVSLTKGPQGTWACEATLGQSLELQPSHVHNQLGLRPIVVVGENPAPKGSNEFVLASEDASWLELKLSDLQQLVDRLKDRKWFFTTRSLFYLLSAVLYHCRQLAAWYASDLTALTGPPFPTSEKPVVTQHFEPYFEFDALVTAIIRAYDNMRYLLWDSYGRKCDAPRNFIRTLDNCTSVPEHLDRRLRESWNTRVSRAKDYRDCIQHYVDMASPSFIRISPLAGSVWTLTARIPDNPEVKSVKRFVFTEKLDALTYAWELTTELFEVADILLRTVLEDTQDSK